MTNRLQAIIDILVGECCKRHGGSDSGRLRQLMPLSCLWSSGVRRGQEAPPPGGTEFDTPCLIWCVLIRWWERAGGRGTPDFQGTPRNLKM